MPKKSASAADIFLKGASRRVDENERARLEQEAADRQAALERQKEQAREARALKKAFPDYYKKVEPLLQAMESLPAKDGDEFFVRADVYLREHWKTREAQKSIDIWVLYTHEEEKNKGGDRPRHHGLSINRKGTAAEDRDDIRLALNGKSVLKLELETGEDGKIKISSHTYDEHYEYVSPRRRPGHYSSYNEGHYESRDYKSNITAHASIGDFAAALGAWVQDTAPDRLPDIAAALGKGSATIPTERMTVRKPIKLSPKPA